MLNSKPSNNQKGFTLVEIIAVLVILGVLGGLAITRFFDLKVDASKKSSESIIGTMSSAATLAFGRHRMSNLKVSGADANDKYIKTIEILKHYLEKGLPATCTELSATSIELPDGTVLTMAVETNTSPALFTR